MNEELQRKAIQFQILQSNMQHIGQKENQVAQGFIELENAINTLTEIKGRTGEAFVPLGAGTFAEGSVKDSNNILVSIGGGIVVKKKREEVVANLEKRAIGLKKEMEELEKERTKIMHEMQKIQTEVEKSRSE